MVIDETFRFPSCGGERQIYCRAWRPQNRESARGVIQIIHGMSEHIERYAPTAEYLADRGFIVVGNDHLGHGRTAAGPEEYGYFADREGWDTVAGDVRRLRTLVGEKARDYPYFLLGHSLGSFLARTYMINWPGTVDGVILSGTGQENGATLWLGWQASNIACNLSGPTSHSNLITAVAFGSYNRQFKPHRTRMDWLSRNEESVDKFRKDPMCRFFPTVGMYRDMMEGMQFVADKKNLQKMDPDTPVLFLSGDKDPVGHNGSAVKKVADRFKSAGVKDITVRMYPDARHEVLNELNRDEVLADLMDWLETHMPGGGEETAGGQETETEEN